MASIVDNFESDCIARIESKYAPAVARMTSHETRRDAQDRFPPATYFLMGIGLGVIAARVACTCIFIPPSGGSH